MKNHHRQMNDTLPKLMLPTRPPRLSTNLTLQEILLSRSPTRHSSTQFMMMVVIGSEAPKSKRTDQSPAQHPDASDSHLLTPRRRPLLGPPGPVLAV